MAPSRFLDSPQVRAVHGRRVEAMGAALARTDPLADAAVLAFRALPPGEGWAQVNRALDGGVASVEGVHPAIAALFEQVERVPSWVDFAMLDRGGALVLRAGQFGGLVLGLCSLPYGYASPGGNKPLALSGRLREQAPRRLMETARFVHAVSQRGAMQRGREGYCVSLKVRLMHATVRRLAWDSGRWNAEAWGAPVNQHDQVATTLLFSAVLVDGLRKLGFSVSRDEAEGSIHLWRYVGWLLGTEVDLLADSETGAMALGDLILSTQGAPDDDSRELTRALLDFGLAAARSGFERQRVRLTQPFSYAVARHLLGERLATQLGVPETNARPLVPAVVASVRALERVRRAAPFATTVAQLQGDFAWRRVIDEGLRGVPATFEPPSRVSPAR